MYFFSNFMQEKVRFRVKLWLKVEFRFGNIYLSPSFTTYLSKTCFSSSVG